MFAQVSVHHPLLTLVADLGARAACILVRLELILRAVDLAKLAVYFTFGTLSLVKHNRLS